MSIGEDHNISRRPDGNRENKRNDSSLASGLHTTQADAIAAGKEMLGNHGRGKLSVKGRNGRILSKNTIEPDNDPFPPRNTEN